MNYNKLLNKLSRKYKNKPIVIFHDINLNFTYGDLKKNSLRIANYLSRLGISKGDSIGIWMGNVPEYIIILAACLQLGVVCVPISTHEIPKNIKDALSICECKYLFMDSANKYIAESYSQIKSFDIGVTDIGKWDRVEGVRLGFSPPNEDCVEKEEEISEEDSIVVLYTSGSTGEKKGIEKSIKSFFGKKGLTNTYRFLISVLNKMFPIRIYNFTPWTHNTGFSILLILMLGGDFCQIVTENFNPRNVRDVIKQRDITIWLGTASMLYRCCEFLEKNEKCFPQIIFSSGEGINSKMILKFEEYDGCKLLFSFYGTTEISNAMNYIYRFKELSPVWNIVLCIGRKIGLLGNIYDSSSYKKCDSGSVLGNVDSKNTIIYDEELNNIVSDGNVGEICMCSPCQMKKYKNDENTYVYVKYNDELYVKTGDLGFIKDGVLYLSGRKKNIIIKSGEKILPSQIESAALGYSGVSAVIAFGVPSERYGEEICLCVEKNILDEEKFKKYIFDSLPKHLKPSFFLFFDCFPQNSSGKIDIEKIKKESYKMIL